MTTLVKTALLFPALVLPMASGVARVYIAPKLTLPGVPILCLNLPWLVNWSTPRIQVQTLMVRYLWIPSLQEVR
jgi:hypothetical protein